MTDRWVGVVALSLLGTGCAGLVGIDDWGPQGLAPEDASGQVAASSSTASSGGAAGGGGTSSSAGGTGGGAGGAASSPASATSSSSGTGGAGGSAAPCEGQPDGASCGPRAADRCCGETCVDISSDVANCGGCDTPCAAGKACESVDQTVCATAPADTSGRCACTTNGQCPLNQVCDAGRCSPDSTANCDGLFVDVASCPNFCSY